MEEVLVCEQETQEMLQYLFEGGDCDHNCNIHCGQWTGEAIIKRVAFNQANKLYVILQHS